MAKAMPPISPVIGCDRFHKSRPPYLGPVATRSHLMTNYNTGSQEFQTQSWHTLRDNVVALKLLLGNWYLSTLVETATGGPAIYTASFSPDAATFSQVKWGKAAAGIAAAGATLLSDWVPYVAAAGSRVCLRIHANCAGILYKPGLQDAANGDYFVYGATTPDLTMGGTISATDVSNMYLPLGILALTTKGSVLFLGDSRVDGSGAITGNDNVKYGTSGLTGELERTLGPSMAFINAAIAGDTLFNFVASGSKRAALAQYTTAVVVNHGINDIGQSQTAAQIKANMTALLAMLPANVPAWITTLPPAGVTSSDNYLTLANQTAAAYNAARVTENIRRLNGIPGFSGCFDLNAVVEDSSNSGKWKVAGTRGVSDGAITSGAATLTSSTASFTTADVGATVSVAGAGVSGAALRSAIKTRNSATSVTLWDNASTTVSGAACVIGAWTGDGTHESKTANDAIAASGNVPVASLAR